MLQTCGLSKPKIEDRDSRIEGEMVRERSHAARPLLVYLILCGLIYFLYSFSNVFLVWKLSRKHVADSTLFDIKSTLDNDSFSFGWPVRGRVFSSAITQWTKVTFITGASSDCFHHLKHGMWNYILFTSKVTSTAGNNCQLTEPHHAFLRLWRSWRATTSLTTVLDATPSQSRTLRRTPAARVIK